MMSTPKFDPVTHIIFDLNGTLLDTERIRKNTFKKIANDCGKQFTDDLRIQILGKQEMDVANLVINTLELDFTPEELIQKIRVEEKEKLKTIEFMDGVENLLEHFRRHKIPMAVATSSSEESFRLKTDHLKDKFSVFHHVVTSASDPDVKNGKPEPDIYRICASRFPENPENSKILVFEDSPNGVVAALAAGMQVVMVPDLVLKIWHNMSTDDATHVLDYLEGFSMEMFSLPPWWE